VYSSASPNGRKVRILFCFDSKATAVRLGAQQVQRQ
jgi:hypothetical protein